MAERPDLGSGVLGFESLRRYERDIAQFGQSTGLGDQGPAVQIRLSRHLEGMNLRKVIVDVSVSDIITLADLRWLVEQCHGFMDDSSVTIKEAKTYSPIDRDPAVITVHGKRPEDRP